jgi:hypothetical protein
MAAGKLGMPSPALPRRCGSFGVKTVDLAVCTPNKATCGRRLKSKPLPVQPTGANMWMKNGERCYDRWLFKDHAY